MSKEKSLCSKRVEWIDVAKAIGVFCVVAGHTGLPILLRCWIYVFHMPMFFFISGMWFKDRKPGEYVVRKAKSYLIPFYGYSLLILSIDFILFRDKDYFVASVIDVLRGEGSFSLLWFLFSLFFVEIIYYTIYRLVKNKRAICIIAFILALIAHYSRVLGVPNYFFWSSTIEAMLFFSMGSLFCDPMEIEKHLSKLGGFFSCIICIIIAVLEFEQTGRYLDLSDGYLCMPGLAIAGACFGIYFVFCLAKYVSTWRIAKVLNSIGRNTIIYYPLTGYIPNTIDRFLTAIGYNVSSQIYSTIFKLIGFLIAWGVTVVMKLRKQESCK